MPCTGKVAEISRALVDPSLYTRSDGVANAKRLGIDLEAAKRELDKALEEWTSASDVLETVNRGS